MAIEAFWSAQLAELYTDLGSGENGLRGAVAAERIAQLPKVKARSSKWRFVGLFLGQFKSPIILILLFAAGVAAALGDQATAIIIFAIVLASGALGFWQEFHAADAVQKLLALVQITAKVVRDGKPQDVPIGQVVSGDVFVLHAGDMIPADSRLLESTDLFVNEAALTGEPFPVDKKIEALGADTQLAQRTNCVFLGTSVVSGSAKAIVVHVGSNTEFGKVSQSLSHRPPETEFERGVRQFDVMLMEVTLLLVLAMFAANVYYHKPVIESLLFSLAIAVGLTPQLLPAIISVNLATGARRMAEKKVIVKRLASIENFGSMDVLCSDKTGTLTDGTVRLNDGVGFDGKPSARVKLFGYLNAANQTGYSNPIDAAICEAAKVDVAGYVKVREQPYDFIRKRLTVVLKKDDRYIAVTKGAVSNILEVCTLVEKADGSSAAIAPEMDGIDGEFESASKSGNRAIGVAFKDFGATAPEGDCESGMTFLGMLLFFDPLRPEIVGTLQELRNLGVSVKFVTGDNRFVAGALLKQAGVPHAKVLSGPEMRNLTDEAFRRVVGKVDIFAEVEPNQKARIVVALQKAGHVVGHLGDGINDASAIHAADVGISVANAVDVAKDAADIVLLEKDLGVLKDGIREGRITFANTLKYVFMATSANFGNMFSMAGASLFLKFLPMLPTQILLTNFMTDLPEMTIATDNVDAEWIDRPHRWDIGFIKRFMVVFGLANSMCDYITFAFLLFVMHANETQFQTGWFIENVVTAALIVLVVRTRRPFWRSRPSRALTLATLASVAAVLLIPVSPIAGWLHLEPLPMGFIGMLIGLLVLYVVVAEAAKWFFYKGTRQR
ncbi:MAG: magnesium-translocating P-type ATPase [Fimbriimonadaceae bacterium]